MSHGTPTAMSPDAESPLATLAAGTVFSGSALVRVTVEAVTVFNAGSFSFPFEPPPHG